MQSSYSLQKMQNDSPQEIESGISAVAKAFATYAMVPYLGILFCPGAILVGSFGLFRTGNLSSISRKNCYISIIAGCVIAVMQLGLWWLLYQIPEWARQ